MNSSVKIVLAAIVGSTLAILLVSSAVAENKAKLTAKEVMQKFHKAPKDVDPVCKKASEGKATKEELAQLVAAYRDMASDKPVKGDAASWKEKSAALLAATEALQSGAADGVAKYQAAVNCKGCHSVHKPAPPKAAVIR